MAGPTSVSLRHLMSPVKHQAHRNSCAAFAAVAMLEMAAGGVYSEQCIGYASADVDAVFVARIMQQVMQRGLLVEEEACPYDAMDRTKVPEAMLAAWQPQRVPGRLVARAFPASREEDPVVFIRQQLAAGAPVSLSLYLFGDFWHAADTRPATTFLPQALVPNDAPQKGDGGDIFQPAHSVVAVGYDDVRETITIKNSWGDSWKDRGYAELTYDVVRRLHSNHTRFNPMVALRPQTDD